MILFAICLLTEKPPTGSFYSRVYENNEISLVPVVTLYESPDQFTSGEIIYDGPEDKNVAIFRNPLDMSKLSNLNLTININSPVNRLMLFANVAYKQELILLGSKVKFVFNSPVK